jgi:hypothetical protein
VDNRARGDTARNGRNVIDCYTLRHPLVAVKLAAFGEAGDASKAPKGEENTNAVEDSSGVADAG